MTGRAMMTRPVTSDELYPIPEEPEIRRFIFRTARRDRDPVSGKMIIDKALTATEREMISNRLRTLAGPIAPARPGDVRDAILQMLAGFNTAKTDSIEEAAAITAQYFAALKGLPAFAIKRACLRFAQGNVTAEEVGEKRIIKGIHPPTPYVRIIADKIANEYRDEASIGSMLLGAMTKPPEPTPEQKAKGAAAVKAAAEAITRSAAEAALEDRKREVEEGVKRDDAATRRNRETLLAEYAAHGLEPVYSDKGKTTVTSLSLLLSFGWRIEAVDYKPTLIAPGGRATA